MAEASVGAGIVQEKSRSPLLVGVLVFGTLGFYASYLLYQFAKRLKKLTEDEPNEKVSPWLWVFPPFVPIALPFALGRLTDRFRGLVENSGAKFRSRGTLLGLVALLALVISGAYEAGAPHFAIVNYAATVSVLTFIVFSICIALLCADVESALRMLGDEFGKERLVPVKLLLSVPGFLLFGVGLVGELTYSSQSDLAGSERWVSQDGAFSIGPNLEGWRHAETGTFSDGSADAEFARSDLVSVVVFDQSTSSFESVLSYRHKDLASSALTNCDERRMLSENTSKKGGYLRVGRISCEGRSLGRKVLTEIAVVDDGDRLYELYGDAVLVGGTGKLEQRSLDAFIQSFSILEKQHD